MVARAVALRPALIADQEETERRTYYSQEMHEEFLDAGFYGLYVPAPLRRLRARRAGVRARRPGGRARLRVDRVVPRAGDEPRADGRLVVAAGGSGRDLRQRRLPRGIGGRAGGHRRTAPTTAGRSTARSRSPRARPTRRTTWARRCSPTQDGDEPPPTLLFVAPRDQWQMLDDWGDMLGLKGSGSHSIRFDHTRIPASWGFQAQHDRHRRGRRDAGLAAARQPDVLGPGDVGVHDLARRGHGRRRLQHARRVRTADAQARRPGCRRFSRASRTASTSAGMGGR